MRSSSSARVSLRQQIPVQTDDADALIDDLLAPVAVTDPDIDDPATWIQNNVYIPETNSPIVLYDSQIEPLEEALRRDEFGNFVYTTILWSAIKKSAKTAIAAAVGMWFANRITRARIRVMGNDLRQAQSRAYEAMTTAVKLREDWKKSVKVNLYEMTFPNDSRIEAIAVDPVGEAGGNDDLVIVTELWGWKSAKHQQMWTETTVPPTKFGQALRWCESYAGYTNDSPVLEQLYEMGVVEGKVLNIDREMYANGRTFVLWNTHPTLPWQTPEYYADQRSVLKPSEFSRVHENKWSAAVESFIPEGWWADCEDTAAVAAITLPVVVALDAAISGDSFAVATVTRNKGVCYVKESKVWYPPPDGKIDYADIQRYVRDLKKRYIVREFAYDEYQLHDMATRNYGKLGFWRAFPQGQDRLIADKHLYDLIRDRKVIHAGDLDLAEHIANANAKKEGDKLRLEKRHEKKKIDAAVALSMACSRAAYYRIGGEA